jgi:hypothetical protein
MILSSDSGGSGAGMAGRSGRRAEGSAVLVLSSSVVHLHPEEAVFEAMLAGWTAQQTARLLGVTTIESRVAAVRRFAAFAGEYPWRWQPADVEDWTVSLRRGGAQATQRCGTTRTRSRCSATTWSTRA